MQDECEASIFLEYFGECIVSPIDKVSFGVHIASTFVFVLNTIPQIIKNFRYKSANHLSFGYIMCIMMGNFLHLTSSLCFRFYSLQIYTAAILILSDAILILQYTYYTINKWKKKIKQDGVKSALLEESQGFSQIAKKLSNHMFRGDKGGHTSIDQLQTSSYHQYGTLNDSEDDKILGHDEHTDPSGSKTPFGSPKLKRTLTSPTLPHHQTRGFQSTIGNSFETPSSYAITEDMGSVVDDSFRYHPAMLKYEKKYIATPGRGPHHQDQHDPDESVPDELLLSPIKHTGSSQANYHGDSIPNTMEENHTAAFGTSVTSNSFVSDEDTLTNYDTDEDMRSPKSNPNTSVHYPDELEFSNTPMNTSNVPKKTDDYYYARTIWMLPLIFAVLYLQFVSAEENNTTSISISDYYSLSKPAHYVGYVLGILSSLFYIIARGFQIHLNHIRKSTHGVSKLMFVMLILGNTLYSIAVILYCWGKDLVFLAKLPWFLGAFFTLVFDVYIIIQCVVKERRLKVAPILLHSQPQEETLSLLHDPIGHQYTLN